MLSFFIVVVAEVPNSMTELTRVTVVNAETSEVESAK
jgi:hypothetical protein